MVNEVLKAPVPTRNQVEQGLQAKAFDKKNLNQQFEVEFVRHNVQHLRNMMSSVSHAPRARTTSGLNGVSNGGPRGAQPSGQGVGSDKGEEVTAFDEHARMLSHTSGAWKEFEIM